MIYILMPPHNNNVEGVRYGFFSSALSFHKWLEISGLSLEIFGVPSWKFWEDLPAAGGNFEDFEMEMMKSVLENGEIFACGAIFFSEICCFHQFDWKIRAEGAKFFLDGNFELDLGASWKFSVKIWAGNFSAADKKNHTPPLIFGRSEPV